jgi:signal transduction histidine kinase
MGHARGARDDRLDRARHLVDLAHRNAKDAIAELRDLVLGIHPAVLDNGLETAVATLARRESIRSAAG